MDVMALMQVMFELFGIMILGYFLQCRKVLNENVNKTLSWLVVNVTGPALAYYSVYGIDNSDKSVVGLMVGLGAVCYLFYVVFSFLLATAMRVPKGYFGTMQYMLIFANAGFMGIPVLLALFGPKAVFYANLFNLSYNFVCYTYGVRCIKKDSKKEVDIRITWRNFVNTGVIFSVISIVTFLFELPQPKPLVDIADMVGGMTTPLSMLIVGASVVDCKWKETLRDYKVHLLSLCRLIIIPVCVYMGLKLFKVESFIVYIVTILAAMPCGSMAVMMAQNYDGNKKFAAEGVVVTTIFSIISVPLLGVILGF